MSRVLDDRGRLFGKVNLVDLVVLVVIVAVVVFVGVRLTGDTAQTVPVKVTFLERAADQAFLPGLEVGDAVTDVGGSPLGKVVSVEVVPTEATVVAVDGKTEAVYSPLFKDVRIVVLGQGTVSGSTVRLGRLAVRVGAELRLLGPQYEAETRIADVVWGAEAVK